MSDKNKGFCFVIMSFAEESALNDVYQLAIKDTVEELGYICQRADEQQFNGRISQQIIKNIKDAELIIADLTQARPNCYYELGIAHTLGKRVVHISRAQDDIHFDVKDFNFIVYSDLVYLKKKLKLRIEGTEKEGSFKLLHLIQDEDRVTQTEIDVLATFPRINVEAVYLSKCSELQSKVKASDAVLFSYTNGKAASKAVESVSLELAQAKIPLITFCGSNPMPAESFGLLTSLGVVAQMSSSLKAALKELIN